MICHKAENYRILEDLGLPVPRWHVATAGTLRSFANLGPSHWGSNFVGFRTELMGSDPKAHKFPHVVVSVDDYDFALNQLRRKVREQGGSVSKDLKDYFIVVNSAFPEYHAHGVLSLRDDVVDLSGEYALVGDLVDLIKHKDPCLMLRDATRDSYKIHQVRNAVYPHPLIQRFLLDVRRMLYHACLINRYVEVSMARTPYGPKIVFWGMR